MTYPAKKPSLLSFLLRHSFQLALALVIALAAFFMVNDARAGQSIAGGWMLLGVVAVIVLLVSFWKGRKPKARDYRSGF